MEHAKNKTSLPTVGSPHMVMSQNTPQTPPSEGPRAASQPPSSEAVVYHKTLHCKEWKAVKTLDSEKISAAFKKDILIKFLKENGLRASVSFNKLALAQRVVDHIKSLNLTKEQLKQHDDKNWSCPCKIDLKEINGWLEELPKESKSIVLDMTSKTACEVAQLVTSYGAVAKSDCKKDLLLQLTNMLLGQINMLSNAKSKTPKTTGKPTTVGNVTGEMIAPPSAVGGKTTITSGNNLVPLSVTGTASKSLTYVVTLVPPPGDKTNLPTVRVILPPPSATVTSATATTGIIPASNALTMNFPQPSATVTSATATTGIIPIPKKVVAKTGTTKKDNVTGNLNNQPSTGGAMAYLDSMRNLQSSFYAQNSSMTTQGDSVMTGLVPTLPTIPAGVATTPGMPGYLNPTLASPTKVAEGCKTRSSLTPLMPQSNECCMCLQSKRVIGFVPCGHVACCKNCSDTIEVCPLCRKKITIKQMLYFS